jgi:hypothetical protein
VPVLTGVRHAKVLVNGKITQEAELVKDATILVESDRRRLKVRVDGSPLIYLKRDDSAVWDFDEFVTKLQSYIADDVLPMIEPFLPES